MPNQSLVDLTERTATADTDLIHVNSGGTDYKETKGNFLSDVNSSINSLNNSLTQCLLPTDISSKITIRAGGYIKVGHIVILNLQFTIVNAVTSSDDLFTLPWPLGGNQAAIPLANYNSGLDTGGILYIRDNGIARLYQGASGGTSLNASGCYISRS